MLSSVLDQKNKTLRFTFCCISLLTGLLFAIRKKTTFFSKACGAEEKCISLYGCALKYRSLYLHLSNDFFFCVTF